VQALLKLTAQLAFQANYSIKKNAYQAVPLDLKELQIIAALNNVKSV